MSKSTRPEAHATHAGKRPPAHAGRKSEQKAQADSLPPRDDDEAPAAPGSSSDFSHGESMKTDQQDHITADRQ